MAEEDDLDAFFEEVSEAEAKAAQEDETVEEKKEKSEEEKEKKEDEEEPPAKRQKKTNASIRPRGVVVAASSTVVISAKEREERAAEAEAKAKSQEDNMKLQRQQQQQQHQQQNHNQHRYNNYYQPSAGPMGIGPAGLPPPPPPPPHTGASIGPAFPPGVAIPDNAATSTTTATGNNYQNNNKNQQGSNKKPIVRMAAGQKWVDPTLEEWPENDYRIFVGNLSNEVTDIELYQHFSKYPSLAKAKVIRNPKDPDKSKGYGFVSLLDPLECAKAIRESDQTWLGSRPIRTKRSDWRERDFKHVKKKQKKEMKEQKRMGLHF